MGGTFRCSSVVSLADGMTICKHSHPRPRTKRKMEKAFQKASIFSPAFQDHWGGMYFIVLNLECSRGKFLGGSFGAECYQKFSSALCHECIL